jgi:hypothetical protein
LVILSDTGSHLKEKINKRGGWVGWGGQIVVPRPLASALLTGRRQKKETWSCPFYYFATRTAEQSDKGQHWNSNSWQEMQSMEREKEREKGCCIEAGFVVIFYGSNFHEKCDKVYSSKNLGQVLVFAMLIQQ